MRNLHHTNSSANHVRLFWTSVNHWWAECVASAHARAGTIKKRSSFVENSHLFGWAVADPGFRQRRGQPAKEGPSSCDGPPRDLGSERAIWGFRRSEGAHYELRSRGSATPMKMGGGGGDQAAAKPGFSSEGNPYQKPKTQRIWPTIFLKMGGIIPRTLKNGGTCPPRPPCGGAPAEKAPSGCSDGLFRRSEGPLMSSDGPSGGQWILLEGNKILVEAYRPFLRAL